jgi:hypothetical protein
MVTECQLSCKKLLEPTSERRRFEFQLHLVLNYKDCVLVNILYLALFNHNSGMLVTGSIPTHSYTSTP